MPDVSKGLVDKLVGSNTSSSAVVTIPISLPRIELIVASTCNSYSNSNVTYM